MILDGRNLSNGSHLQCDVLVVGSGPAGITLSRHLSQAGVEVIVLEAGGRRFSRSGQNNFAGEVVTPDLQPPLHSYRMRQFGGGSNVWGGRCSSFDDIDFEQRSWVPESGWPITNSTLRPYYSRAHEYLDLGEFCYNVNECFDDTCTSLFPGMIWNQITDKETLAMESANKFSKEIWKGAKRPAEYASSSSFRLHRTEIE